MPRYIGTKPTPKITSTGGTITQSGGYTIHTFTTSVTFTIGYENRGILGLSDLSVPSTTIAVDTLLVAGGGGGAGGETAFGGGGWRGGAGGAGGMLEQTGRLLTPGLIQLLLVPQVPQELVRPAHHRQAAAMVETLRLMVLLPSVVAVAEGLEAQSREAQV